MSWLSGLVRGIGSIAPYIKGILPQIGRAVKVIGDISKPFVELANSDTQDAGAMADTFLKSARKALPQVRANIGRMLASHKAPKLAENLRARGSKKQKLNEEEEIPEGGFTGKERYDFEGS